jgi:hypothetical protein
MALTKVSSGLIEDNTIIDADVNSAAAIAQSKIDYGNAIIIPVGTTAQRPTGVTGMIRFNSTTTRFEGYNGSAWVNIDNQGYDS